MNPVRGHTIAKSNNGMKIISWNVNGLRAINNKGYFDGILKENPDILCLQETKAEAEQLSESVKNPAGYFSYFSHSRKRKGYSGVAIYTKQKPDKVEEGMGREEMDQEGRLLVAYYPKFVILNCYFPNGGGGPERLAYKLEFYDNFLKFIEKLHKKGHEIIVCGDINTAHEEIDLARPKENEKNTGFLPEERVWIDELINHGYIDTFRHLHPNTRDAYTYWDIKTGARNRNVGWRLDYFFTSSKLLKKISHSTMLSDFLGSDHCPIEISLLD